MSRLIVALIIVVLLVGLAWPWLRRMGLGRLPGDVVVERKTRRYEFPFTSTVLLNLLLAVVMRLLRR